MIVYGLFSWVLMGYVLRCAWSTERSIRTDLARVRAALLGRPRPEAASAPAPAPSGGSPGPAPDLATEAPAVDAATSALRRARRIVKTRGVS